MARQLVVFSLLCTLFIFGGCGSRDTSGSNVNDTENPTNVTNFNAAGADQSVALSWSAASDNIGVAGYYITNTTLGTTRDVGSVTSYTWDSLTNGTTYTFSIVAYDGNNNQSPTPATDNATPYFDDEAPDPVTISASSGGWDTTDTYVEISFSWTFSASTDMGDAGAEYWISISSGDGTVWDIAENAVVPYTQNTIVVPDDPADGRDDPIDTATFAIDTPYLVQIIAVDPHGNESTPTQVTIVPTESSDTTPPIAVTGLYGVPDNQSVTLTWDLLADATYYNVYYSVSPFTTWVQYTGDSNSADNTATVTNLTNGIQYMFLVAGVDAAGNETAQADAATAGPYIPSSNSITLTPNIRGGIFRSAYFTGKNIVVTVSSSINGLLAENSTTKFYYTLTGADIDLTDADGVIDTVQGCYTFDPASYDEVVTRESGSTDTYVYTVKIDFEPLTGDDYATDATDIDALNTNNLRPDGSADHIVLRMMVVTDTDASKIFEERYFIYGNSQYEYLKFSGMKALRQGGTATYIKDGLTKGDVICIGGSYIDPFGDDQYVSSAERYRSAFEHYEDVEAVAGTKTMTTGGRIDHTATLLDDPAVANDAERILVLGGWDGSYGTVALDSAEIFDADPAADGFEAGPTTMDFPRRFHTATRLTNGQIFITGGIIGNSVFFGPYAVENTEESTTVIMTQENVSLVAPIGGVRVEIRDALVAGNVTDVGTAVSQRLNTTTNLYEITVSGLQDPVSNSDFFALVDTADSEKGIRDLENPGFWPERPTLGGGDVELFSAAGAPLADAVPNMNHGRFGHTATLLSDGRVFITGGLYNYTAQDDDYDLTSEIFDPTGTGSFLYVDNSAALLSGTRYFHNAVLLRDGKVLITGGLQEGYYHYARGGYKGATILNTAEVFDPFTLTTKKVGNMKSRRFSHASALLPSGKVLVCGGYTSVNSEGGLVWDNTAELYDPATGTFSKTGNMIIPRNECTTTLIKNTSLDIYGKVLVCGGSDSTLAELFDEEDGAFSVTAHGVTGDRYVGSAATTLADGTVLITGGQEAKQQNNEYSFYLDTAEIYNTSKARFEYISGTSAGKMSDPRRHHTATLLQDGTVLIAGGENEDGALTGAEIFDSANRIFSQTASMLQPRFKHTATLLPDGKVFIAGGSNKFSSLSSTEIYDPVAGYFTSGPTMVFGRFDHQANLLPNGWVMISGGSGIDDQSIEIYDSYNEVWVPEAWNASMLVGRDGHQASQQIYAVGKARFTNGLSIVTGTGPADTYGNPDTSWDTSGIKPGDIIMSIADNTPYLIGIVAANQITLADNPYFTYDDSGYAGTSTADRFAGGNEAGVGFEDYIIISQDVYITGGDVLNTVTEVFDFDQGNNDWINGNFAAAVMENELDGSSFSAGATLNDGRYGHVMTPLADMSFLVTGGELFVTGEYLDTNGTPGNLADDTWVSSNLDSALEHKFNTAFRVSNGMVLVVRRHAAQVFFAE